MDNKQQKIAVGEDAVVIGQVTGTVGNRSVVIGATDNNGNTILNQPMAIGYCAKAGPNSIAIGAYAGAGGIDLDQLASELSLLRDLMNQDPNSGAHQAAIAEIVGAAKAAKENDGASVLRHLKAAGQWAWDFATKAGASLTANIIAKAIGL
jgi:hypothetical protein